MGKAYPNWNDGPPRAHIIGLATTSRVHPSTINGYGDIFGPREIEWDTVPSGYVKIAIENCHF